MQRFKEQSGRSMIEMLGVLAIVGVLSVGALAGYSTAMAKYKANQAVKEINDIIIGVKSLYSEKSNYEGVNANVLVDAGVIQTTERVGGYPANVYGEEMNILPSNRPDGVGIFQFAYFVSDEYACREILLNSSVSDLGADLYRIMIHNDHGGAYFRWDVSDIYKLPVQMDGAIEACEGISRITFMAR
jgi:type II secretory pathway pseudopilin PulG